VAHEGHSGGGNWLRSRRGLALIVFLGIAGFLLATEHTAHLFGALPLLLLLGLCLVMHLFMHGGHGGQDGHAGHGGGTNQRSGGAAR
jgi:Sec-independent protein secretion pathway component TatC